MLLNVSSCTSAYTFRKADGEQHTHLNGRNTTRKAFFNSDELNRVTVSG